MAAEQHFVLVLKEVDLLRAGGPGVNDVLDSAVWQGLMLQMQAHEFDMLVITPPCSTFSRARFANSAGPTPLRTKAWPWGFPWLEGVNLAACELGNEFIRLTFEALQLASNLSMGSITEHPEDLGATNSGELPGSLWAMEETFALAKSISASTVCFFQCPFGAASSKPTRLLSTIPLSNPDELTLAKGWPRFAKSGRYLGPLPARCGHKHQPLIGRSSSGSFRTSASAAYPASMCKWLAREIVIYCLAKGISTSPVLKKGDFSTGAQEFSTGAQAVGQALTEPPEQASMGQGQGEDSTSSEDEEGITRPLLKNHKGGVGMPVTTSWGGKSKEIHDGGGLCSPGRWMPGRRRRYLWKGLGSLRHLLRKALHEHIPDVTKVCCQLATGKLVESPFSDSLLESCRNIWFQALEEGKGEITKEEIRTVPEFQVFYLPAIGETLRLLGDPDWRIYFVGKESFSKGVPIGFRSGLPRTPAVFPRKTKWRSYEENEEVWDMENYQSAANLGHVLQEQFQREADMGMMYETTLEQARLDFPGDSLRVAANGAIEKSDHTWRIIHDGTHGVAVNPGIRPRDQQKMPVAGDARGIMLYF